MCGLMASLRSTRQRSSSSDCTWNTLAMGAISAVIWAIVNGVAVCSGLGLTSPACPNTDYFVRRWHGLAYMQICMHSGCQGSIRIHTRLTHPYGAPIFVQVVPKKAGFLWGWATQCPPMDPLPQQMGPQDQLPHGAAGILPKYIPGSGCVCVGSPS